MSPAARIAKIHLRTTPRRVAAAWIAWVHAYGETQAPDPLPELLDEMESEILDSDPNPPRGRPIHTPGENRLVLAAKFQCFVLIDIYSQLLLSLVAEMTSSFTLITSVFSYTDLERIADPALTVRIHEQRQDFSHALAVLDLFEGEQIRVPVLPAHLRQMTGALQTAFELAVDLVIPNDQPINSTAPDGEARDELDMLIYRATKVASERNSRGNVLLLFQAAGTLRNAGDDYLDSLRLCFKKAVRRVGPRSEDTENNLPGADRIENQYRLLECFRMMQDALLGTGDKAQ